MPKALWGMLLPAVLSAYSCGSDDRKKVQYDAAAGEAGDGGVGGMGGMAGIGGSTTRGGESDGGAAGSALAPLAGAPAAGGNVSDAGAAGQSGGPGAEIAGALGVASGGHQTCVVLSSGAVRCWGPEGLRLGYGNAEAIGDDETPESAGDIDIGGKAVQVTVGFFHTCALLDTGGVRCWGAGNSGELGYGNTDDIGDDETPASAGDVDVGGKVTQISAGYFFTCALLSTGAVRCWGAGMNGVLGYGNTKDIGDDETPASAGDIDLGGKAQQIATGNDHACAVLTSGKLRCWGLGWLGYGTGDTQPIGDDETPASAGDVDVGGVVTQVTIGSSRTCAVLATGNVRCWGLGQYGALGYGNQNNVGVNESPASAGDVDVGGQVAQISAGAYSTCALLTTGKVRCWGANQLGELGYGNASDIGDDETPASAGDLDLGGDATQVAVGFASACARLSNRTLRCWGENNQGQLGYGNTIEVGDDETPASAGDVPY